MLWTTVPKCVCLVVVLHWPNRKAIQSSSSKLWERDFPQVRLRRRREVQDYGQKPLEDSTVWEEVNTVSIIENYSLDYSVKTCKNTISCNCSLKILQMWVILLIYTFSHLKILKIWGKNEPETTLRNFVSKPELH